MQTLYAPVQGNARAKKWEWVVYQLGFSRVIELMSSLYIVREFVDDLQSVVQLSTMVSSSCEWESKDLAVAQSHNSSRRKRESKSSFFQCPHVGLQQKVWPRLKVCATMPGSGTCFVPNDLELRDLLALVSWDSQPLCLKISMPRFRSETCISQPQDQDHRRAFQFRIVVIPNIVKLTTRNNHYNPPLVNLTQIISHVHMKQ